MSQTNTSVKTEMHCSFLCFEDIKSGNFKRLLGEKPKIKRSYNWNEQESYLYMCYLKQFGREFQIKKMTKFLKFFTRMGNLIGTRTSHQIKSHHQKLWNKYKTIEKIVEGIEYHISMEMHESQIVFERIKKKFQEYVVRFQEERMAINQLFREYRKRVEKQGGLTPQLENKLLEIVPDLPRSENTTVKIQEFEADYIYFETSDMKQQDYDCKKQQDE